MTDDRGFQIPAFRCPDCGEELKSIPQLFPKVSIDQERPAPGFTCQNCGRSGDFGETLPKEQK